jgi:hypothetical protein
VTFTSHWIAGFEDRLWKCIIADKQIIGWMDYHLVMLACIMFILNPNLLKFELPHQYLHHLPNTNCQKMLDAPLTPTVLMKTIKFKILSVASTFLTWNLSIVARIHKYRECQLHIWHKAEHKCTCGWPGSVPMGISNSKCHTWICTVFSHWVTRGCESKLAGSRILTSTQCIK